MGQRVNGIAAAARLIATGNDTCQSDFAAQTPSQLAVH